MTLLKLFMFITTFSSSHFKNKSWSIFTRSTHTHFQHKMVKTYSNRYFQIQIPFEQEYHPRSSRRALIIICLTILIGGMQCQDQTKIFDSVTTLKNKLPNDCTRWESLLTKKQCRLDGKKLLHFYYNKVICII